MDGANQLPVERAEDRRTADDVAEVARATDRLLRGANEAVAHAVAARSAESRPRRREGSAKPFAC
jgi:hypothetical protein